jgi:hypothetical protein
MKNTKYWSEIMNYKHHLGISRHTSIWEDNIKVNAKELVFRLD